MEHKFACVISCIDGRIQESVMEYMRNEYCVPYIDTITIAGPVKVIAENKKEKLIKEMKFRAGVSVTRHDSQVVAVVGHHDCALAQMPDDIQIQLVKQAVKTVKAWGLNAVIIGLFVDGNWNVNRIC